MKTLLIFAICILGATYAAGALALPTGNLLSNPGFEASSTELTGWTNTNGTIRNHDPNAHGGQNYVFGSSTSRFSVSQDVDLAAAGLLVADIDTGSLGVDFGGWQSGWQEQRDYGQISINLLNAAKDVIGSASLPTFYSNSRWFKRSGSTALLAGTRFIHFNFLGMRVDGSNDDAYLDDAFLEIVDAIKPPPAGVPEPAPLVLFAIGLAGLGLARWRLTSR